MIASIMDSYITEREEFQLTRGYQPTDSLFYLKSGVFSCSLGEEEAVLAPGTVAVFDRSTPMARHVIEPISFLYIKFTNKSADVFPLPSRIFSSISEREKYDLSMIERLCAERTRLSLELREHYLNDLLLGLYGIGKAATVAQEELPALSVLERPIAYMKENLSSKLSVSELARHCGISQSSLESKFRRLTGSSAYGYFIQLRRAEAVRLLCETSLPVTDIAARCGYENLFYFCNAFKKQTGMTPTEYRRANII